MTVDLEPDDGWGSTSLYVRNIPADVKLRFKSYASMMGMTMTAVLVEFMRAAGKKVRPYGLATVVPPDLMPEEFFDVDALDYEQTPDDAGDFDDRENRD